MPPRASKPPLLIALPCGLSAGGVTTWAVTLANALARSDHPVGLILHRSRRGDTPLEMPLDARVARFDLADLPSLDQPGLDLAPFVARYRDAASNLRRDTDAPVVCAPTLTGDCFAIAAALSQSIPEHLRLVGWLHAAGDYDRHVLAHYEPCLSAFVAVSDYLKVALHDRIPARARDITSIVCAAPRPARYPAREPLTVAPFSRPLRLIHHGRLDDHTKRSTSLIAISDALAARCIPHELAIIGDGPAAAAIDAASRARPIRRIPTQPHDRIHRILAGADIFLLPSRTEGLSLSMLEAMAQGCVPIVTRTPSGAEQAVSHAKNGLLVDAAADATGATLAESFAREIEHAAHVLPSLSLAAWESAARFSIDAHADAVQSLLRRVADSPPRPWPAGRPPAFNATVPPDAAERLAAVLDSLAARRVIIHGTGRHTLDLESVIRRYTDRVIAFSDDDPARHPERLFDLPIIAPAHAAATGATDVIISSWLHQGAIFARRAVYEQAGLSVHRLYPPPGTR